LHVLRGLIGTEKFWQGIREYYRRYRDSNASTDDLRRVVEDVSGRDLQWFFQQWLTRAGSPAVTWSSRYDAAAKKVELIVTQTQAGDAHHLPTEPSLGRKISTIDGTARWPH